MKGETSGRLVLFVAAHAVVLAGLAFAIVAAGTAVLSSQRERIDAAEAQLALALAIRRRDTAVLGLDPTEVEDAAGRFIQGKTPSVQTASLLALLKTFADQHAVTFATVSILPNLDWQGRKLAGARVEFVATNERVAAVVQSIEQGRTLLFIRRAEFQASGERPSQDDAIAANLEIYGLPLWPGG